MIWNLDNVENWINNGCNEDLITELDLENVWTNNGWKNLKEIPNEIYNLLNLEVLKLSYNKIKKLPNEINNLQKLKYLDLSNNKLENINEIEILINLRDLNLSNNLITDISYKIENLINLETLNLSHNSIKRLPNEIGNLINLKKLFLNNNKLKFLFDTIGNLTNLQYLMIRNNDLCDLPVSIGNNINLLHIDAIYNNFVTIPIEITNILNLQSFTYDINTIDYIPVQIIRFLDKKNIMCGKFGKNTCNDIKNKIEQNINISIEHVMKYKPTYKIQDLHDIIINNKYINEKTKVILYDYLTMENLYKINEHKSITFSDLLLNVLSHIDNHIFPYKIYDIFEEEINNSINECFISKMSRLVNTLYWFCDNVSLYISEEEQIDTIVRNVKNKLLDEYDETYNKSNYSIKNHKKYVKQELLKMNYTIDKINTWLNKI
jgi:hypothetical protein